MKSYTVYVGGSFKTAIDIEANNKKEAERIVVKLVVDDTDLDIEIENVDVIES